MSEYNKPSDEDIRNRASFLPTRTIEMRFSDQEAAESDRWLAEHDREVAAKALTDAARLARSYDANHVADILDERAVSLVPGNPEPGERQCSECSSSLARCENAKSDGYIKCCPDCRHPEPTEGETRG